MKDVSYKTISKSSDGFYKEKGSKFLAFAFRVENESDVKTHQEALRKQYHDARHHCYAYRINKGDAVYERANDDGEPNHSAGDPILGQIKSFELSNTLVVVIRYFGGTKLGVSGLINAYKTATEEALSIAPTIIITLKQSFELIFPYDKTSDVQRLISEFAVDVIDQQFLENCTLTGELVPSKIEGFKKKIKLAGVLCKEK